MNKARLKEIATLVGLLLLAACSDDDPKPDNTGTTQTPDASQMDVASGTFDMAESPDTGADADAASEITEGELANCAAGDTCIVVPYSHCCGATRRAINAANEAEYNAHPEWQDFNDPATCATIGACMSDGHLNTAKCEPNGASPSRSCRLVSACERMFACAPAPIDLLTNVAASQDECDALDIDDMLPAGLRACVDAAADCDAIAECVNCRTSFASEFCRVVACPLAVNECLFAADEGQCTIDCDNITGGAIGCFPGYELTCWQNAADANDCSAASNCFVVY